MRFLNLLKANAEVDDLQSKLTAALAAHKVAKEESDGLLAQLTQANADLETAKTSLASLTEKLTAAEKAKADAESSAATVKAACDAKLAELPKIVESEAANRAAQIVASLGVPPVSGKLAANPAVPPKSKREQSLEAIQAGMNRALGKN